MQTSSFNLRVPLPARDEVFLLNTLTDAQVVVSNDVVALLDRIGEGAGPDGLDAEEREAVRLLSENGFLVESREAERRALDEYFATVKRDTSELNVTVLTTLQCNFACDYCYQGDHGDHNRFAEKPVAVKYAVLMSVTAIPVVVFAIIFLKPCNQEKCS